MASQANISIIEMVKDDSSIFDDDFDDSKQLPLIPNAKIMMRFGNDGGPSMINYMMNCPFYFLKSLCFFSRTYSLQSFTDLYNSYISSPNKNETNLEILENIVSYDGRLFGSGPEYIAQVMSLSFGTQIFTLASEGEDLWGQGETPDHIITCYGQGRNLIVNFEISEDTHYSIGKDPDFFLEIKETIQQYNETVIGSEFEKYYIQPLERGFTMQFNMVLAIMILKYQNEIMQKERKFKSFILEDNSSLFED